MYARGHDNATEQLGYIVWFSQNEGVRFTVKATVFSIIIHYSSLLIILIVCVCTVWSFITVSFIIYTLKINLFFWGLCIDTNKKKTTNLFVEPLLTAEITAQHEMLRCLLTEVTLQTEQQQLYSETFSNSKLNNSEIRVWDKQGLTQNCSSPTYSVFLAFFNPEHNLLERIECVLGINIIYVKSAFFDRVRQSQHNLERWQKDPTLVHKYTKKLTLTVAADRTSIRKKKPLHNLFYSPVNSTSS